MSKEEWEHGSGPAAWQRAAGTGLVSCVGISVQKLKKRAPLSCFEPLSSQAARLDSGGEEARRANPEAQGWSLDLFEPTPHSSWGGVEDSRAAALERLGEPRWIEQKETQQPQLRS